MIISQETPIALKDINKQRKRVYLVRTRITWLESAAPIAFKGLESAAPIAFKGLESAAPIAFKGLESAAPIAFKNFKQQH
ncbi:hypothetical protein JTE90_009735 [Oedothorax gibbosus]|uniref:Uncharacterized protein n=1 Tax=Oedothorax gibbosus TaxID=931172 RepID=A0AAV6V897_9ARAC|nr:hypothetical protein JTE90_009735 [Oedothorax gibbosus]